MSKRGTGKFDTYAELEENVMKYYNLKNYSYDTIGIMCGISRVSVADVVRRVKERVDTKPGRASPELRKKLNELWKPNVKKGCTSKFP